MALEDDCKNQFRIVHKQELERYTWKGNPIELHTKVATIAHFRDTQPKRPLESVPPDQSTPLDVLLEKPIFGMHQRSETTPREKSIKSKAPLVPLGFEREK